MRRVVPVLLLSACVSETATLEEGCQEGLGGASLLGEHSPRLVERINCYRRHLGVNPMRITEGTQRSVQFHLDYLAKNHPFAADSADPRRNRVALLGESRERPGYTGDNPFERNVAAGATVFTDALSVASVWGWFVHDASVAGDVVLAHPYARDAFFQPYATGAGFAEGIVDEESGVVAGYLEIISPVPSGRHTGRPIVFPKDGQEGVPTGWVDKWAGPADPFSSSGLVGYPITVTVSEQNAESNVHSPFGVELDDVVLVDDEDHAVPVRLEVPTFPERLPLRTTVAVVPLVELLPGTTYTFTATVHGLQATWKVESTFTTRDESFVVEDQTEEFLR